MFAALGNGSLAQKLLTDIVLSCPSVSAANKQLTVSDETTSSMRVSWVVAPGRVSHYRLRYVPNSGGREVSLKVPGTSTLLQRLRPITSYNITVHPIYKRGEGKARQGVGTTRTLVHHSTSLTETANLTSPQTHQLHFHETSTKYNCNMQVVPLNDGKRLSCECCEILFKRPHFEEAGTTINIHSNVACSEWLLDFSF